MKIICLSDTHGQHNSFTDKLPPIADMIIHAGDLTRMGSVQGVQKFIDWFANLPYKHKIFVAGNHDFALQEEKSMIRFPENVIYLENNGVVIDGVKIWGSPVCSSDPDWAFNFNDFERNFIYNKIPEDCDIIISHNPPHKIMDKISLINKHIGCKILKKRIELIKPKLVIFGHVHEGAGIYLKNCITYINTACNVNVFEDDFSNKL